MKRLAMAAVFVTSLYFVQLAPASAKDDLPIRIAHLEKSLASIEREEAAVARKGGDGQSKDNQARNARAEMLLAEIRRNIAVTIADLRDDNRPGAGSPPRNQTSKARVLKRVFRHSKTDSGDNVEEPKEIEVHVVIDSDARKPKPVVRKSNNQPRRDGPPRTQATRGRRGAEATSKRPEGRPSREAGRHHGHAEHFTPNVRRTRAGRPQQDGRQVHAERPIPSTGLRAGPPQRNRVDHLRAAATHLDAAGYETMAKKARAEISRLARATKETHRSSGPARGPIAREPAHFGRIDNAVKELRKDVDKLRKEVAAIKKQAGEMSKERRAGGKKKEERSRKAKEAASKKKKNEKKQREIEQKKRKKELEEKRKLERQRREHELKKKRKAKR